MRQGSARSAGSRASVSAKWKPPRSISDSGTPSSFGFVALVEVETAGVVAGVDAEGIHLHVLQQRDGLARLSLRRPAVAAEGVAVADFQLAGQFVAPLGTVQILKDRQVGLGEQGEAAAAGSGVERGRVGVAAKGFDGDEQERGRGQQARREQAARRVAGGVAHAEPGHAPPAACSTGRCRPACIQAHTPARHAVRSRLPLPKNVPAWASWSVIHGTAPCRQAATRTHAPTTYQLHLVFDGPVAGACSRLAARRAPAAIRPRTRTAQAMVSTLTSSDRTAPTPRLKALTCGRSSVLQLSARPDAPRKRSSKPA